jgi:repressor of nif and glnA expression
MYVSKGLTTMLSIVLSNFLDTIILAAGIFFLYKFSVTLHIESEQPHTITPTTTQTPYMS